MRLPIFVPRCVLCFEEAITTVAHIPVCREHHDAFHAEAKQGLSDSERVIWLRLRTAAGDRIERTDDDPK